MSRKRRDVALALPERGQPNGGDVEAKKRSWRNWPVATAASRSTLVAATTRTSKGTGSRLPRRTTSRS